MAGETQVMLRIVDDSAESRLVYTGDWISNGTPQDYNNTVHSTNTSGAAVRFTFSGTRVSVYGRVTSMSGLEPTSQYVLDNSTPVKFKAPRSSDDLHQQPFFQSPPLNNANHTLVITNRKNATFSLDYITYVPSSDKALSGQERVSLQSEQHGIRHVPAIVGAMLAGTLCLVVLVALCCFYCKRRRPRRAQTCEDPARWTMSNKLSSIQVWREQSTPQPFEYEDSEAPCLPSQVHKHPHDRDLNSDTSSVNAGRTKPKSLADDRSSVALTSMTDPTTEYSSIRFAPPTPRGAGPTTTATGMQPIVAPTAHVLSGSSLSKLLMDRFQERNSPFRLPADDGSIAKPADSRHK